jgi:3-ketosteroid 9alpha-monooxygenase subunit A
VTATDASALDVPPAWHRDLSGWYVVAFEHELERALTPVSVAGRRLMLVARDGRLRAFDATCPRRGAHLPLGGRLDGDHVVCPFHGYRVRLGCGGHGPFAVAEHPVLARCGMVFVQLGEEVDHGWAAYLEELEHDQHMIDGFALRVRAPMEAVIENAFDRRHFDSVHGIHTDAFAVFANEDGALEVESIFYVPPAMTPAPYRALVASPGIAAVTLGGPFEYTVITGATDDVEGRECTIRLSVAFPRAQWPDRPPPQVYEPLLEHSRRGLEEDCAMWENLDSVLPRWTPEDASSLRFLAFCSRHRAA